MKYLKSLLVLPSLLLIFALAPSVTAQNSTTDNSNIQESLQQNGLDQAPAPVEVEDVQLRGSEPYSGFVDEDGNPMSDEEYEQYLKDQKGLFRKYPWLLPVVLVAIGGVVFTAVKARKRRK